MRFICTDEGYVNLDHVIGIRNEREDEWLITTTAPDVTWNCTCSRQELEDQLRIASKPTKPVQLAKPGNSKEKAFELLVAELAQRGEAAPHLEERGVPPTTPCITTAVWRARFCDAGISKGSPD